ncbi:uncharacterized protein LOC115424613 isoform X1 [Sphaeramia orbicularis]|uniref:uncharacterized protein LOC115424613 isoform X1 n=1 Tax=Sphaeramia orbicularis TaxID=375764 RepID=UPI00117D028E|nr:uncharacterized protein LOC115424613 isoform X1 [Sphaeramia orbicularis]
MKPKKVRTKDRADKKKKPITIELKKEIIQTHERGVRVVDLARQYNRNTSTICTILKKKDEIKALTTAKGVSRICKQRTYAHEEMEKRLLQWIKEKQQAGGALTETIICEKARMLYVELLKQNPGPSADETPAEEFKASRGWLDNFKKRTGYAACNYNSDGGGQANPNTSPQNTATTQGGIKEESTDMMMSADSPTVPHTVLVGYKFENPGLDVTTPDHDTAQLHAMELQTWAPEGIKASGSSQFSGVDLDSMDLDQLKREKIKMQLKVLKLQEEYYMLQIKKLKQ